jgi:hypothetical protein
MIKWFQNLLQNSPELAITFLFIIAIIFLVIVVLFSLKASKNYFESITLDKIKEVEKDILSRLAGYENNFLLALDDIKNQVDFKKSKFLILNDSENTIQRILNLCELKNTSKTFSYDEAEKYSAVIVYLKDESDLVDLTTEFDEIPNEIIKVIYYDGFIKDRSKLPKNNVLVNFEYTLIEKLHSIYLVKKIMEK